MPRLNPRPAALRAALLLLLLHPVSGLAEDEITNDPFAVGATWVGDFQILTRESRPQKWALVILDRKAESFAGELSWGEDLQNTLRVVGKAASKARGSVVIRTERSGFVQGAISGSLSGGAVALSFRAFDPLGKPVAGTGNLKRKN